MEEATRITPTTSNILDLVFTTHPNAIFDVHIIPGISDHDAIVFTTHSCAKKQKYNARKMYQFSQADFEQFRADLYAAPMSDIIDSSNIEKSWYLWKTMVLSIADMNIPQKQPSCKHHLPWMNSEIRGFDEETQ